MTIFLWLVVAGVVFNVLCAGLLLFKVKSSDQPALDDQLQHSAAIVLAVRGMDPRLGQAIQRLLNQNFEEYSILVVVDNKSDPAWSFLHQTKLNHDHNNRLKIVPLEQPLTTCSLKCSALIQATQILPTTTQWVAFVDADVVPHENWLADVLGPLAASDVAVVTGNQWFEPPYPVSNGALLRSIWNAGALVPTILLKHPWAGTMAVKYNDLISSNLIDDWKVSIVDDGPVAKFAKRVGGKVVVHPALLMVNRDDCSWQYAQNWIARMLTWSRIFEPTYPLTVCHALVSVVFALGIDLCLIWAILFAGAVMTTAAIGTLLVATILSVLAYCLVRNAISISLGKRGLDPLPPLALEAFGRVALMMGPVQICYLIGCFKALVVKSVVWRGVEYRIAGNRAQLVKYCPWAPDQNSQGPHSI